MLSQNSDVSKRLAVTMFKRSSGKWENYIEKLAAANEKSYGSQKLDCCGLNSDTQAKTSQNSSR